MHFENGKLKDLNPISISSYLFLFLYKEPRQRANFILCVLWADKVRSQMTWSLYHRVREKLKTWNSQKGKQSKVQIGDWHVIQV